MPRILHGHDTAPLAIFPQSSGPGCVIFGEDHNPMVRRHSPMARRWAAAPGRRHPPVAADARPTPLGRSLRLGYVSQHHRTAGTRAAGDRRRGAGRRPPVRPEDQRPSAAAGHGGRRLRDRRRRGRDLGAAAARRASGPPSTALDGATAAAAGSPRTSRRIAATGAGSRPGNGAADCRSRRAGPAPYLRVHRRDRWRRCRRSVPASGPAPGRQGRATSCRTCSRGHSTWSDPRRCCPRSGPFPLSRA